MKKMMKRKISSKYIIICKQNITWHLYIDIWSKKFLTLYRPSVSHMDFGDDMVFDFVVETDERLDGWEGYSISKIFKPFGFLLFTINA